MKNVKSWQIVSWIVVGFVLLLMAYQTFRPKTPMEVARVEAQRLEDRVQARRAESPPVPVASCSVADIVIVSTDGGFVDECRRSACPQFKGVGVLRNGCSHPVGVQIKIEGLDESGRVIATRELWPASTRNIAPGEYSFDMGGWLDHDPRMASFRVSPIDTNVWR